MSSSSFVTKKRLPLPGKSVPGTQAFHMEFVWIWIWLSDFPFQNHIEYSEAPSPHDWQLCNRCLCALCGNTISGCCKECVYLVSTSADPTCPPGCQHILEDRFRPLAQSVLCIHDLCICHHGHHKNMLGS